MILLLNFRYFCVKVLDIVTSVLKYKKKLLLWVWTKISKAKKSELTPSFQERASGGATSWCRSFLAAGSASSTCRMPCAHKKGALQGFRKCQVHSMAEKMGFYTSLYFYFQVWIRVFFLFYFFLFNWCFCYFNFVYFLIFMTCEFQIKWQSFKCFLKV